MVRLRFDKRVDEKKHLEIYLKISTKNEVSPIENVNKKSINHLQGAITGLVCGIGFALFLGFGQPKPIPPQKSFSLDDCTEFGGIKLFTNYSTTTEPISDMLMQRSDNEVEYMWLMKVSYLWYGVLGFLITFIVGYVVSISLDLCNLGGPKKIYLDTKKRYIDTELFSPPISRQLKKQNARFLERDSNVSIVSMKLINKILGES